jgi:hypothetical protein
VSIEAMKQMVEALETIGLWFERRGLQLSQIEKQALEAGRQAIVEAAKQEQGEPVGEMVAWPNDFERVGVDWISYVPDVGTKLYTTPQQRKPLTNEQLKPHYQNHEWLDGVRFAEAAHGIKGNV